MDEMEQLAYKNRFVRQLVQDLNNYEASDVTPQVISGPDNLILLKVSYEEWVKLLSSVFTGADICYPSESDSVRWILLRAVEQPMDFCAMVANAINECEDVRDAVWGAMQAGIGNVPSVQNAFREWWLADQQIRDTMDQRYNVPSVNDAVSTGNILKPDQCLDDYIFNQCVVLVDLLNDVSIDIFQAVEVGTNQLERWGIFTSAIPATGQIIPVDEGLAFINQLVEELAEDYDGAFDTALRNEIACDIFCIAKDGCTLSLDQAIAYYQDKASTSISLEDPASTLQQIVSFIATGDFPGDVPVYAMHLLSLTLMKLAQKVFGVDFTSLYLQVIAAGDTPNNDWELLCDDCALEGEWELYPDNPFSFLQPVGEIVVNDPGVLEVNGSLGTDGIYRVALIRPEGCIEFASWSVSAGVTQPEDDHGCDGWVGGPPFAGPPNFTDRLYIVRNIPFTINATW